ncbi:MULTISPECIES: alginate lyase family protein [unclassified Saccharicrinis]|uniref:alginate lyase family protein n=1 Tax=unclassified Saccharicrinis TaxID=2646859 RepID=UPI003D326CA0
MKSISIVLLLFFAFSVQGQLKTSIGKPDFSDWSGALEIKNNTAVIKSGAVISYRYPDGENWSKGYRDFYHGYDWSIYKGLSLEVYQKNESSAEIDITFNVAKENTGKLQWETKATVQFFGSGWHNVYVPWKMFNLEEGRRGTLQGVKEIKLIPKSDKNTQLQIRNVVLTKGDVISLEAPLQGLSTEAGGKVQYEVEIGNATNKTQRIQLLIPRVGWEAMEAVANPSTIELKPGETKKCMVEVSVPASLPQGVREKQVLKVVPNGNGSASATLAFTTAVKVPSPFMVHTLENWDKVIDKIGKYDWAKEGLAEYEAKAQKWNVPEYTTATPPIDAFRGPYLFHNNEAGNMMNCAIAYRLTGNMEYARKCVEFLRKLSDEEKGYPVTYRVNQNNFVKEGGVFQDIARGYDMIMDCGLLTNEDHKKMEKTLRLYIETAMLGNDNGGINNWDLSELAGAFYAALVIQDWHLVDGCLNSPSGIYRQFTQGVMSDGWWYECAVGYNLWCSTMFSEMAIAMRPWGENFVDAQLPIGTTPYYSLLPERMKPGLYGMNFDKWGAIHKPSVGIKDMWDALIPFLDYRGVMFAVNDAKESLVVGEPYELAYYLYRDPEYAAVIQRSTTRNLLYGVPEVPMVESEKIKKSAFADNMGIVQLRSQTQGREQREQIQAALHYGTFGGYHGHFDRTNFLSMMRYGRSFYNPEMYWYGYKSYLYKFLVQTSINKNMVAVDQKMQEPKESFRTLFYTGDMMQATAVETQARWSNPPYGGMIYGDKADYTFAQKAWEEGRSIPVPDNAPEYSKLTDFTKPVLQRRLMVMMDDYVVLADYIKAGEEHTYDWLFQMKGFKEIIADKVEIKKHENQMSFDPLSSAQFTTDCNWYATEGTSRAVFEMCFGDGCDNDGARMEHSEDGPLKIDVFTAWPQKNEVMIGTAPESFGVNKQLWYSVKADDETLLNDSTGAWILGSKNIELNIEGKKQLVLSTQLKSKTKNNTIFWGNARLVLKDGSEVSISSLDAKYNNIIQPEKGLDYYGGPIKVGGEPMPNSTPGMPKKHSESGEITIDLSGMDAVRLEAKIGGDFPLGDESSRRKTMAVRTQGQDTRYLSVIEPYETTSVIKSVTAKSADVLIVELLDGRTQEIVITGLNGDGKDIQVSSKEFLNGELIREESNK